MGIGGIWLDFDSLGNQDASHGTFLLSGSLAGEVGGNVTLGGRVGLGATLVNFDDPAFRDVSGTTFRVEATVDYAIGDSWALWARPLSLDILTAQELGGPITTWQMRIGVAYRFGGGHKVAAAPPAPTTNAPTGPAPAAAPIAPPTAPPAAPAAAPASPTVGMIR
jgi:hypothetical protein